MKKVTFCFITIVLILTLGGMGFAQSLPSLTESNPVPPSAPLPTPVTVPSSNLLPYSNPTHGFSFSYPSNWKQNTEVDGTGFLKTRFYLLEGDNTVALFSVFSSPVESSLSQWAITQEEIMMNPQEMPGYKKISEEAINLGGLPAIKRLYTYLVVDSGRYSQTPVKGVDIYLVENNKGYVLAGEAVQDIFDRILPEVEIIFNSFKLSGGVSEITTPVSVLPPITITPEPPSTSNLFQYTDPTCSFSFNFPDNWKEFEEAEVEGTLKAELGFWEGDYLLACFYVFVNDTDLSLSQYSMQEEEWMMNPQNMADYRKISEEAINIGSLPAIQRLYTYTFITNDNSKIPLKAIDVYIVNNNKSYMLVGEVDQDKFERMLADLAIMFNSFAITEEPVSVSSASELPPITISDTGSTISTSSTTSETAFKFCPYCGAPLQTDYQFCPGCGKPITIQRTIKAPKEEEVGLKMVVSQAPSLKKTWVLRSSNRDARKDISMGSLIGGISSKIGNSVVEQTRSSSSLWGCLSTLGQGITYEIGAKRETETLPSITPTSTQTTPTLPIIPPFTGPGGIVSPTPEAPAQGGITLTPPGQTTPAQPGPGGITLPTPGLSQEPQIIWKQYSLSQAFGRNPLIIGYLEYPSIWLINLDSFNRSVTFSEDASGLTSLTIFPGLMGQFSSAQDLAQQMAYLLQQQVPDLSILNQEFKIVPTPGGGAIEVTEGRINLQGSYQGTTFRFNLETYVLYMGAYGSAPGMSGTGYVILTQASQNIFAEKEQKYFNHMILSYKRALGVIK